MPCEEIQYARDHLLGCLIDDTVAHAPRAVVDR